ncbi:helix-turn-helix transcriptional regulator [Actinomyces wuliandei]|uniref:helix-turn-helix transcriptional regulator n=1 Tax=Actinomyces wuliandei TaxID=2057743 RepID=UPI001117CA61|nr:response regulator transcription factor [Actinomyces wuliandei]
MNHAELGESIIQLQKKGFARTAVTVNALLADENISSINTCASEVDKVAANATRRRILALLDILSSFGGLSDNATAVAVVAIFLGGPFEASDISRILPIGESSAKQTLTTLRTIGMISSDGHTYFFLSSFMVSEVTAYGAATSESSLSRRELEVAGLISEGLTNRQIARRLEVSERTVETYVRRLFEKLDCRSRTEVAAWLISSRNADS